MNETLSSSEIGERLSAEETAPLVEQFHRDGYIVVPNVLSAAQVAAFRAKADELLDSPALAGTEYIEDVMGTDVLRYTWELDALFRDAFVMEPILGLVEAILDGDARLCGGNIIRSTPGNAISLWHVDDVVEFPLPPEIPRHDARMKMPVQWTGVQMPLTDIEAEEFGPTQFVPGSHYSGRRPESQESPQFEGRGPEAVLCKAGDIYIQNFQCWHRGAPNLSNRTRYVMQMQYAQRWAATRFGVMRTQNHTQELMHSASERLQQVLGHNPTR